MDKTISPKVSLVRRLHCSGFYWDSPHIDFCSLCLEMIFMVLLLLPMHSYLAVLSVFVRGNDKNDVFSSDSAATHHTHTVELPMSSPSSYTSEEHAPSFTLGVYPTHQLLVTATTPDYEPERLLHDDPDIGGVGYYPTAPQQLAEAEVHIPGPASTGEVISNSVRVHPDEDTPKSSIVDPSPLVATDTLAVPVEVPSPVPMRRRAFSLEEKRRVFYPMRNAAVRVTSFVPDSLQLPPGPRRRIVISSASSLTSSCDGDESEVTSDDSIDGVIPRGTRVLPHSTATGLGKKRWTGSYEYLAPGGQREVVPRAQSVSPTPLSGSSVESYSEDDTVLVTRRRVDTHRNTQTRGSFFNLSPAPSMEVVEFSTPYRGPGPSNSSLSRSSSLRLPRERHTSPYPSTLKNSSGAPMTTMSRTVPLSAITHTQ